MLGPALWFAPALVAIPALGLAPALLQGVHALVLNPFLVAVWLAGAGTWWLATLVPALLVPVAALHAATLWTGYRDLWLGRAENAPRPVPAPRAARAARAAAP